MSTPFRIITCFFLVAIACVARGQSPAFSTPAPSTPQAALPPQKPQTLEEKTSADYHTSRNAAVKVVNDKYAQLSLAAMPLFLKENNQARADEAKDWARRLSWMDDGGNFNNIFPDNPDRLGVLQNLYLKERAVAVMAADQAALPGVAAAQKQAAQQGDAAQEKALAQLLVYINRDMAAAGSNNVKLTVSKPPVPLTPGEKVAADYNQAKSDAVKVVNQKYIKLAQDAADAYLKESNQAKSDEAKDWARRMGWTDGGNLLGMSPDTTDRLGVLQTAYLTERAAAVAALDKTWLDNLETARAKATSDSDTKGVVALLQTVNIARKELGIAAPAAKRPPAIASGNPAPPAPQSGSQSNPFGVRSDQVQTVTSSSSAP